MIVFFNIILSFKFYRTQKLWERPKLLYSVHTVPWVRFGKGFQQSWASAPIFASKRQLSNGARPFSWRWRKCIWCDSKGLKCGVLVLGTNLRWRWCDVKKLTRDKIKEYCVSAGTIYFALITSKQENRRKNKEKKYFASRIPLCCFW